MTKPKIFPVIMSGGSGTRLWPLSRELFPKQFHPLMDTKLSVFQQTVLRTARNKKFEPPIIISNEAHRFIINTQLQEIGITPLLHILEPAPRSTAPAIAAAALMPCVSAHDVLIPLSTDHFIGDPDAFCADLENASLAAASGWIVVFGLTPTRPDTEYGYIEMGPTLSGQKGIHTINRFLEKPSHARAEQLILDPQNLWNLGIFVFQKSTILNELALHAPDVLSSVDRAVAGAAFETDFCRLGKTDFEASPSISIDYAVMEKTDHGAVMPVSLQWSDLGTWSSLLNTHRELNAYTPQSGGNVIIGDVRTLDVTNSYVRSDSGLVTALGLNNVIIVSSGDAVLVADAARSHDVGKIVEMLRLERRRETRNHLLTYRPWGHFLTLAEGPKFQVKILTLKPGAAISLQYHNHRAEHWVIVEGEAAVTLGNETRRLSAHDAIDVGVGIRHRLANVGTSELKVIEVQSGDYLGEDDITRLT